MPITYTDKELYVDHPEIPTEKKFRYTDANEIKTVVNANETTLGTVSSVASAAQATANAAQPGDADLTAIAGLTPTNDDFLQRKSGLWANRTIAQVKSDLSIVGYTDWSASLAATGFSSFSLQIAYYRDDGVSVHFVVVLYGTSNSTTFTFKLPTAINALYGTNGLNYISYVSDNGTSLTGRYFVSGSSDTVTLRSTVGGGLFTAAGSKGVQFELTYMK